MTFRAARSVEQRAGTDSARLAVREHEPESLGELLRSAWRRFTDTMGVQQRRTVLEGVDYRVASRAQSPQPDREEDQEHSGRSG